MGEVEPEAVCSFSGEGNGEARTGLYAGLDEGECLDGADAGRSEFSETGRRSLMLFREPLCLKELKELELLGLWDDPKLKAVPWAGASTLISGNAGRRGASFGSSGVPRIMRRGAEGGPL